MKPILEWYEQLPEPIRSQAIDNYDGQFEFASSSAAAICDGFDWSLTKIKGQGVEQWLEIYNRAERGEFDDPITKLHQLITKLEERQKQFETLI